MRLLEKASQRVIRYLDGLDERNVAPTPEAASELARLEIDLPEDSTDPKDVIVRISIARSTLMILPLRNGLRGCWVT